MASNDETVMAAARLVKARSPLDPALSAPESWRDIGIDLQYDGQLVVRVRPVGDDATDVEVFRWGALVASERLRRYRSPERLAGLIEAVHRRAIEGA
jgi:hypothetical protein